MLIYLYVSIDVNLFRILGGVCVMACAFAMLMAMRTLVRILG